MNKLNKQLFSLALKTTHHLAKFAMVGAFVVTSYGATARADFLEDLVDGFNTNDFRNRNLTQEFITSLEEKTQRSLWNIKKWEAKAPLEAESCRKSYAQLYRDGVLSITLAFGYHDFNKETVDGSVFSAVAETLQRECPRASSSICGFSVISRALGGRVLVLQRVLRDPPADLNIAAAAAARQGQQGLKIQITLAHPSVSKYDADNFAGKKLSEDQTYASKYVDDLFFNSISGEKRADGAPAKKCDVCMYYGHARDGGGPDFYPVPYDRRGKDGHTQYEAYHVEKAGYRHLLNSLSIAQAKNDSPQLVSIQACYSHTHFFERRACLKNERGCQPMSLRDFSDKTGFILTKDFSWPDNYGRTLGIVLDTVLGNKCRSAWDENNRAISGNGKLKESYDIFGNFLARIEVPRRTAPAVQPTTTRKP